MNPEEATNAVVVRTRGHLVRNIESVLEEPRASLNDTEDNKVLGLDIVEIGFVSDAEGATSGVIDVVGMNSRDRLPRAAQVRVGITNVTAMAKSVGDDNVVVCERTLRKNSRRTCSPCHKRSQRQSNHLRGILEHRLDAVGDPSGCASDVQEHVNRILPRVVAYTNHPPLGEGHVVQRHNGSVVIGVRLRCNVKSQHGRMPYRYRLHSAMTR